MRTNESPFVNLTHRHYMLLAAGLTLALVSYHAIVVLRFGVARIGGATYFLIDDDPMISMRYGRNLASGLGLVYNEGEQVEGFTNPLFTFLCAGLHLPAIPEPVIPGFIDLTNLLLSVGIMLMLTRFWGDTPPPRFAGLAAAVFYVTLPNHNYHAHGGFEVYMVIFVLVFALWRIERLGLAGAFLVGLLPLTHGMALPMWAVLVVGILLVTQRPFKSRLPLAAVAIVPFVGYEVFRIAYYHDVLPNTYWLKGGAGTLQLGIQYGRQWLRDVWPLAVLAVYPVLAMRGRKVALMVAVLIANIASTVALGGDIFPQSRFLFPASVLLVAMAGCSILPVIRYLRDLPRAVGVPSGLVLAGLLLLVLVRTPVTGYRRNASTYDTNRHWNIRHIAMGLAVRDNTPADAVVGLFGLGYTGYYGERFTVDMLGKADTHIAHTPPIPGRLIGHNKIDFDYVILRRKPDLLELALTPDELEDTDRLSQQSHTDIWGYGPDLGLHPAFRKEYSACPVFDARGRFAWFYSRNPNGSAGWNMPEEFFTYYPRGRRPYYAVRGRSG